MIPELTTLYQGRVYITPVSMPIPIDVNLADGWTFEVVEHVEGYFVLCMPASGDALSVSKKALGRSTVVRDLTSEEVAQVGNDLTLIPASNIVESIKDLL